jgi:uncharacterized protein DUF4054
VVATVASFKTQLPEFEACDDARVQAYLDMSATFNSATTWGSKYDFAVTYLAAHMLTMDTPAGGATPGVGAVTVGGAVSAVNVGAVGKQFAAAYAGAEGGDTNAITDLASTKYGLTYSRMKRTIFKGPIVMGGSQVNFPWPNIYPRWGR